MNLHHSTFDPAAHAAALPWWLLDLIRRVDAVDQQLDARTSLRGCGAMESLMRRLEDMAGTRGMAQWGRLRAHLRLEHAAILRAKKPRYVFCDGAWQRRRYLEGGRA